MTYLDVGQGASTFIHMANGSRILLDGGGSRKSSVNTGERIIAPYLWKQRIWRLDKAIITHPHSDHFNGMGFILAHFQPKKLYINGDKRSEGNYTEIIKMARLMGTEIVIPRAGQDIVRGRNIRLEVLGMNGLPLRRNVPVNDKCLVLKYTHGRRSFLFPADISTRGEAVLLLGKPNLKADVLLAAHHGSATSNSPPFIAATDPVLIVVSAGKNGQTHYPAPANLAAWQKQKIQTYITRDQGTITCTTDGNKLDCTDYSDKSQSSKTKHTIKL
jgi:competence protein ComEC